MIVGFTGTRKGMTPMQQAAVVRELRRLQPERVVHGDCIGADADFDATCAELRIPRNIRPCTLDGLRARCDRRGAAEIARPQHPMQRNRAIVDDSDALIACPPNFKRIRKGSGTWATIGFGERKGIELVLCYPDGTVGNEVNG